MRADSLKFSAIIFGFFISVLVGIYSLDPSSVIIPGRWLLYASAAILLFKANLFKRVQLEYLVVGCAVGSIISATISCLQIFLPSLPFNFTSDSKLVYIDGSLRASGIWGHPNGNAHVTMIGCAAAVSLASIGKRSWVWLSVATYIFLAIYLSTQTRATIFIFCALILWLLSQSKSVKRIFYSALATLCTLAIYILYGDQLHERFFGSVYNNRFSDNIFERMQTMSTAFLEIAFNPIGVSVHGIRSAWVDLFGFEGVHNSFIFGTLAFGWFFAWISYLMIVALLIGLRRQEKDIVIFSGIPLSIFISSFFEDLVVNPSFSLIFCITIFIYNNRIEADKMYPTSAPH